MVYFATNIQLLSSTAADNAADVVCTVVIAAFITAAPIGAIAAYNPLMAPPPLSFMA